MDYYNRHGIKRKLFIAITLQHNGVVERNNRIVQEMDRTMLTEFQLTYIFWTQVVNTIFHIKNGVMLINNTEKTPYELRKGR
jgi:hypothetical protein